MRAVLAGAGSGERGRSPSTARSVARAAARASGSARFVLAALLVVPACEVRDVAPVAPEYERSVRPILEARCAECHGAAEAQGGFAVGGYLAVLACDTDGNAFVVPTDAGAPILSVLDDAVHGELLTQDEREVLAAWVGAGAPSRSAAMHPVGWIDPRSAHWHGAELRAERFRRMLDLSAEGACGRCHAGAPRVDPALTSPPEGATPCTDCHREPRGVLACGTCHGDGARAFPPRDACFFPEGPEAGAHVRHVEGPIAVRSGLLGCETCHPVPDADDVIAGTHANGFVDVGFGADPALAEGRFDAAWRTCDVACHARGGEFSEPAWIAAGPLDCQSCHASPPVDHYPGECSYCHPGVNALGTRLEAIDRHMNFQVDFGDGSGLCGACHGTADDPWPSTGAHPAHAAPAITTSIDCADCHVVPAEVATEGHLDRTPGPEIRFSGRAVARGAEPVFDAETKTCTNVACHGAGMTSSVDASPVWRAAAPGAAVCGSCHLAPPPPPHTVETSCQASLCHGAEVSTSSSGLGISSAGRAVHIDGEVRVGGGGP